MPSGRPPEELSAPPLVLRRWRLEDLEPLELEVERSRTHLSEWLEWASTADRASLATYLLATHGAFEARTDFGYALLNAGALLGGAGLHARRGPHALEIGYWVAAGHAGQGYATAAARALTAAAFALGDITRLEIRCDEANVRSAAVPRKLGYRLDRVEVDTPLAPGDTGRLQVWLLER